MKIAISADDLDVFVNEASQRGGHGRRLLIPHGRIAYERQVQFKLSRVVANETEQILGTAFLFALYHHRDGQWQRAGNGFERAAGLNERHRLAFVVASATRDDDLATVRQRFNARLERRCLPQIQGIDRLDIIVSVEQHPRTWSAMRLADHTRMAGGRTNSRLKTDRLQIGSDMIGCRTALILVGGISGNRSDPQQREQSSHALINILVDAVQHRLESFHEWDSLR